MRMGSSPFARTPFHTRKFRKKLPLFCLSKKVTDYSVTDLMYVLLYNELIDVSYVSYYIVFLLIRIIRVH